MGVVILTRYGYPKVPGDQPESIADVTGPASYTPLVPGSPGPPVVLPTGGQKITAQDFSLQSLDYVRGMASADGKYYVQVVPLLADGTFNTLLLAWMNLTGGTQASGDLSKSTVRLFARGR